jgi:hypothetical protein
VVQGAGGTREREGMERGTRKRGSSRRGPTVPHDGGKMLNLVCPKNFFSSFFIVFIHFNDGKTRVWGQEIKKKIF